jgi:putative ABC transport system ATP-binding protein
MILIEAKNLEKIYSDGTEALRGASLKIEKKEFVAIMGPSGSGKSTLLHILGFLDKQTKGKYFFLGKELSDYSKEEIALVRSREMGFVFQMFNLLPKATVLENVKLPLLYSGVKEAKRNKMAKAAIKAVDLEYRIDNLSTELSGGEKQRVAIARALVNNPSVIFADEPTGNLDSKSGKLIMDILERLNREEDKTVILITHETSTATYADRTIKILDGLVESDTDSTSISKAVNYQK